MRTQIKFTICLLLAVLGFKALPAQALDTFLCIDGIQGESTSQAHQGCIDVLAWSWGMSSDSSAGNAGQPPTTGIADFKAISVTKYMDRASPPLGAKLAIGGQLGEMILHVDRCDVNSCGDYYKLKFPADSLIIHQSIAGGGGEPVSETLSFVYPRVEWCYYYRTPQGSSTEICDGWDLIAQRPYRR